MNARDKWEAVLDHYRHPVNYGTMPGANAKGKDSNVLCGDSIEMHLKIADNKIEDIRFQGQGCAISLAATSMLTETVKGKALSEVSKLTEKDIMALLGIDVSASRVECAILGLNVLKRMVSEWAGAGANKS